MRTIVLFLISVVLIFACQNGDRNNQILTAEETNELLNQNLRKQIVSFREPLLIDTSNSVYLIPVKQKFLDKAENIEDDDGVLGLMSSRKSYKHYSAFNNIAIYFDKSGVVNQVMKERYLLRNIDHEKIDNDIIITFTGINNDTSGDKKLNYEDLSTLFVYSVNQDTLLKVYEKEMHVISYDFIPFSKNLIVVFGHDRDGSGEFDRKDEPTYAYRFDFEKAKLKPIVDSAQLTAFQEILDGKN